VQVTVNGQLVQATPEISLAELVKEKGWQAERIVVELNDVIISRTDWVHCIMKQGDKLEVVTFVGGG